MLNTIMVYAELISQTTGLYFAKRSTSDLLGHFSITGIIAADFIAHEGATDILAIHTSKQPLTVKTNETF